jgi:hypothetical protein
LKPAAVDGLGVYLLINTMADTYTNWNPWGASKGIAYVYENTQAAVSYAIPNIGLARLQYKGAHPALTLNSGAAQRDESWVLNPDGTITHIAARNETAPGLLPSGIWSITAPEIQFAFAFTGVPNLTVDVGVKYPLPVSDPKTVEKSLGADDGTETLGSFQAPISAALGVKYVAGNLTATIIADGKFAGSYDRDVVSPAPDPDAIKLGMEIRPWVTVQYKINDTFTAQAEGGIVFAGESKQGDNVVASGAVRYGFGAAVQTTFAPSCTLRSGITYAGGKAVGYDGGVDPEAVKLPGVFSVPLVFGVSF